MSLPKIRFRTVNMGCDPEFFFRSSEDDRIVGAEKVIPKQGLSSSGGRTIIDGIACEINPQPNTCRESLAGNIIYSMQALRENLRNKKVVPDFSQTVTVTKKELDAISAENKKFGCAPSLNVHDNTAKVLADPEKYLYRSAGGHIHLGYYTEGFTPQDYKKYKYHDLRYVFFNDQERTVMLLDYLLGNTFVLLDPSPGNKERRKNYGRAGEFRTPLHGIEYRVLSNRWLLSQPLMSLAFGLARQCICIMGDAQADYFKEITSLVPTKDIVTAINENDFDLAYQNFKKLEPILMEITPEDGSYPLNKRSIEAFHYFVSKGMEHWQPKKDILDYWCNMNEGGFYWLYQYKIAPEMAAEKLQKEKEKVKA